MKALFDTNILIDFLKGISEARIEFDSWEDKSISLITWIEIMVGASDVPDEIVAINEFLAKFEVLPIENAVAAEAVRIRKARQMKLPDAIVRATANLSSRILITTNVKDFPPGPRVRVPYGHPSSIGPAIWQALSAGNMLPPEGASATTLAEFAQSAQGRAQSSD